MPSALNSFELETQHPSLLERTATGRPTRRRLNTRSQDTKKLLPSTSPIVEPELFKKVTGLNVKDFELLVSLNLFNEGLMNDAVYKFKRYEDASLEYTGLKSRHEGEDVGLYSTVLSAEDYAALSHQQRESMVC